MIKDPPLLTIRRGFARPPAAPRRALQGRADRLSRRCDGRARMSSTIPSRRCFPARRRWSASRSPVIAGRRTIWRCCGALDVAESGDIIVAGTDGFTGTAVTGDLLLGMARNKGVAGFVTDGLVRDIAGHRSSRAAGLLRRRHAQLSGPQRPRHGRISGGARRCGSFIPATSWSAIATAWWWCRASRRRPCCRGCRRSRRPSRSSKPKCAPAFKCLTSCARVLQSDKTSYVD